MPIPKKLIYLITNPDALHIVQDQGQVSEIDGTIDVEVVQLKVAEALLVEVALQDAGGFVDHAL